MPTELKMPQLGESVHEGTISRWLKKPGERVERYEPLLEVATDKVESEVTAPEGGIVQRILVPEGETVKVGTLLALIGEADGIQHETRSSAPGGLPNPPALGSGPPAGATASAPGGLPNPPALGSGPPAGVGGVVSPPTGAEGSVSEPPRLTPSARVSPLAARIAQATGVDVTSLHGSGPGGLVTKDDILRAKGDRETGGQGDRGTGGQGDRETGSRGAGEQGSGGAGEQGSRGAGETGTGLRETVERGMAGFLSPRVQMVSAQLGVDVAQVRGTGKGGRVTARDVEAFAEARRQTLVTAPSTPPPPIAASSPVGDGRKLAGVELMPGDEIIPLTLMRRVIAEHMLRSKQTAPHVTTIHEADVTRMVQFFKDNFDNFRQREGFNLTYTPFFVQAVVNALKAFPQINVAFTNEGMIRRHAIQIGMAVALADGGLIVPVIKNADEKTLVRLARDVVDLATRARAKKLTPDDTRGGTFTLSNYGVFGSLIGTPVINQPEAAILGVGAVKKRPVVIETDLGDQLAIRSMVYLSLTFDHRAFDGGAADQFMQRIVHELEQGDWRL